MVYGQERSSTTTLYPVAPIIPVLNGSANIGYLHKPCSPPICQQRYIVTEDISVTNFREYLKIPTVHPDPDYDSAVNFLSHLADQIGLQHQVVRVLPDKPVLILTWLGRNPQLPSLLLNSHMDVVPASPEHWKYDPFSGHKDENGDIFGRGAQDMKCVGMQYLEAIRRIKGKGEQCSRTIHLIFVPDEEVGGYTGMALFVDTPQFKTLNVGLVLDEGVASENGVYIVNYAERVKWHLKVTCTGNPGHGSKFIENTAAEKLQKVVNKFLAFREEQKRMLESDENLTLGDVTTVNLGIVNGGVQVNVIPAEITVDFDIRVSPTADFEKLTKDLESWVEEAGAEFEWIERFLCKTQTKTDDSCPWWTAFSTTMQQMGLKIRKQIFFGGTDAMFLRHLGYPAFGFSPMVNTPQLLHDHDERLNEQVYLKGVEIYSHLIPALANVNSF